MNAATHGQLPSAHPAERRRSSRTPAAAGTHAHRLISDEMPMLRVQVSDVSKEGVGLTSMIPLTVNERVALSINNHPQCEVALCEVRHAGKSPGGHFRAGLQVILRQPGQLTQMRIPADWIPAGVAS